MSVNRRRIEEALSLFAELERTALVDDQDAERFRLAEGGAEFPSSGRRATAVGSSMSTASAGGPSSRPVGLRGGSFPPRAPDGPPQPLRPQSENGVRSKPSTQGGSAAAAGGRIGAAGTAGVGGRATSLDGRSAPSTPSPSLTDEIVRRMHEKNQALIKEVKDLKEQLGGKSARATHGQIISSAQSSASTEGLAAQLSCSTVHDRVDVAFLRARVLELQAQLDELQLRRLDSLDAGEATGRVNKDVKEYFVAMRNRLLQHLAATEAERILYNEILVRAELDNVLEQGRREA